MELFIWDPWLLFKHHAKRCPAAVVVDDVLIRCCGKLHCEGLSAPRIMKGLGIGDKDVHVIT